MTRKSLRAVATLAVALTAAGAGAAIAASLSAAAATSPAPAVGAAASHPSLAAAAHPSHAPAVAAAAHPSHAPESIFQDDDHLIYADTATVTHVLNLLKGLGVDRIRVTIEWKDIAPDQIAGMICYLRSLTPEGQNGTSNFGGGH